MGAAVERFDQTRAAYARHIRDWLTEARTAHRDAYLAKPQPDRNLRQHAAIVDQAVQRIASDCGLDPRHSVIAVGGYGRGFLFPASDVDLLVLLPSEADEALTKPQVEAFVTLLWDAGLEPGISVRTADECLEEAAKDITVDTSLLEMRHLWGDATASETLEKNLRAARNVSRFVDAKIDEQHKRHARHNDIALNLEPNIKESPGGLRDLHTVMWIARASGVAEDWRALARAGQLTDAETRQMMHHRSVLIDFRIRLHYLAKRREDRLVFDHQSAIAAQLGLTATQHKRASELVMARYYRSAKAIWQLNSILIVNLRERIKGRRRDVVSAIDAHFELVNGNVAAIDENCFEQDPRNVLRAFIALQRTESAEFFAPATLRALWRAAPRIDAEFRRDPVANQLFLDILQSPKLTFALRRMSRFGLLGRFLPAFGRIVGLMQHDLFHVYTVDEHILMVLRNMRRLVLPKFAHEFPFCHSLAREFDRPHLLYIACLFHDIAKGRGGDHSHLGMRDARRFCQRLQLSSEDTSLVEWLVEMHLMMSSTAQKQDLADPEVISQFAARVTTERRLVALYLLTVADVRGTSPHVWNAWKAKLLEDLFRTTRRLLRGDAAPNQFWVEHKREAALSALEAATPPALWSRLDAAYFQRFDTDDIVWHARLGGHLDGHRVGSGVAPDELPIVATRPAAESGAFSVAIFAHDQRGLFARLTAVFERLQLDVVNARITTANDGLAIDGFEVVPKSSRAIDQDALLARLSKELRKAAQATDAPPSAAPTRLPRQQRHQLIEPSVSIRHTRDPKLLELSLTCADRPGLLSTIGRFLVESNISLHDARITTLGARVEDVFVVSSESPAKISEAAFAETASALERLLGSTTESASAR